MTVFVITQRCHGPTAIRREGTTMEQEKKKKTALGAKINLGEIG